jgi:hypothetical protein
MDSKNEPAAHSPVNRLASANGSAPGMFPRRQLYRDNAINKKIVKSGSQISTEYKYCPVMSAPLIKKTLPAYAAIKE